MKSIFTIIVILCTFGVVNGGTIYAQDADQYDRVVMTEVVSEAVDKTLAEKIEESKAAKIIPGPDTELAIILNDLQKLPPDAQKYAAYFTFYHLNKDPQAIKEGFLALSFWIHSLSNQGIIRLPQLVEGGNGTLFRVDIRDYGWDLQSWENVARQDPYFREPFINHEIYSSIRLITGNILVRGDWFIDATSTPVKQIDNDEKTVLYYELIYGKHIPKNREEFYKFWRIDVSKIEGRKNLIADIKSQASLVQQILIKEGTSGVARNNRVLARAPTELGYLWETSDFKNSNGARNVIANLYPGVLVHPEADAGELIASDVLQLHKYFVVDRAGNRVDIADPGIAFDKTNPHDSRVMTGRSCVECHAGGINKGINVLRDEILVNNKLKYADYDFKIKADTAYFSTMVDLETKQQKAKIDDLITKDSELYNQAVFNIVGLTTQQNAVLFRKTLNTYNSNITLSHAAAECGVTVEEFQEKCLVSTNGQLNTLARGGGTVTREAWEYPNFGIYQEAMTLIWGVGKNIKQDYNDISTEKVLTGQENELKYLRIINPKGADLVIKGTTGRNVIGHVPPDTVFDILKQTNDWYLVEWNKTKGYLNKKDVELFSNNSR